MRLPLVGGHNHLSVFLVTSAVKQTLSKGQLFLHAVLCITALKRSTFNNSKYFQTVVLMSELLTCPSWASCAQDWDWLGFSLEVVFFPLAIIWSKAKKLHECNYLETKHSAQYRTNHPTPPPQAREQDCPAVCMLGHCFSPAVSLARTTTICSGLHGPYSPPARDRNKYPEDTVSIQAA